LIALDDDCGNFSLRVEEDLPSIGDPDLMEKSPFGRTLLLGILEFSNIPLLLPG
jgi:hypothetical protein